MQIGEIENQVSLLTNIDKLFVFLEQVSSYHQSEICCCTRRGGNDLIDGPFIKKAAINNLDFSFLDWTPKQ